MQQAISLCYFLLIVWFIYFLPGKLVVNKYFKSVSSNSIYISVGLVLWTLSSLFLSYLGLRNYILLLPIVCFVLSLKSNKNIFSKIKVDKLLLLAVSIGVIFQLAAVFTSGTKDSQGIWFYHINAYDGLYYLGLVKSIVMGFPPLEPGFSGNNVVNYHYLSALSIADISRLFKIDEIFLVFRGFPLMISFLRGFLAYQLSFDIFKSKKTSYLFVFLSYFGSDLGILVSGLLLANFSFSLQAIDTASLSLVNPPRAFSEVILLAGLILMFDYLKKQKKVKFVLSSLILISSVGFKVYTGIFAAVIIALVVALQTIKDRKLTNIILLLPAAVLGAALFFPTNRTSGGLFWVPFAWPSHYFASGALSELQWHLREQVFKDHNNYLRLYFLNFKQTAIFFIIIFGTRVLGLFPFKLKGKPQKETYFVLLIAVVSFLFLGTFFLQRSGIYNTFNFYSTAALILSLFTAAFLNNKNKTLIFIVLLLTLPKPLLLFKGHVQKSEGYLISSYELQALNFLKSNTDIDAVILVDNKNERDYYSPYVEIFSERQTYLSNLFILESHNQAVEKRRQEVRELFSNNYLDLNSQNYDYLYLKKPNRYSYPNQKVFYENLEVIILEVS